MVLTHSLLSPARRDLVLEPADNMANRASGLKTPANATGSSTPSVTGLRRQIAGHKGQLKKLLVANVSLQSLASCIRSCSS